MGEPLTVDPWIRQLAPAPSDAEFAFAEGAWANVQRGRDLISAPEALAFELARYREQILEAFDTFADAGAEVFADQTGEDALRALIAGLRKPWTPATKGTP